MFVSPCSYESPRESHIINNYESRQFRCMCSSHFFAKKHKACKTWDVIAYEYYRADGIGSLPIKILEEIKLDNDNILGVILGAGSD